LFFNWIFLLSIPLFSFSDKIATLHPSPDKIESDGSIMRVLVSQKAIRDAQTTAPHKRLVITSLSECSPPVPSPGLSQGSPLRVLGPRKALSRTLQRPPPPRRNLLGRRESGRNKSSKSLWTGSAHMERNGAVSPKS
jgi:hypothetical protein